MRNHSDIAGELRKIACVMYERKQDKETSLKVQNDELKSRTDSLRTALAKIEETLKQAGETLAVKKGMEALTRQNIDDEEKQLAALMEKAEILLAEMSLIKLQIYRRNWLPINSGQKKKASFIKKHRKDLPL